MDRPELPSAEIRDQARRAALSMRHQALVDLREGRTTWQEVLYRASTPEGKPLRKLQCRKMLEEIMASTPHKMTHRWMVFRDLADVDPSLHDTDLTISWLLDNSPHRPGRRLSAWCDVLEVTHAQRRGRVGHFPWHLTPALAQAWGLQS